MAFPLLRFTSGLIIGAAGLSLIIIGALRSDLALVTPGIALIGPLAGFFIGEANGRRHGEDRTGPGSGTP